MADTCSICGREIVGSLNHPGADTTHVDCLEAVVKKLPSETVHPWQKTPKCSEDVRAMSELYRQTLADKYAPTDEERRVALANHLEMLRKNRASL